MGTAAALDNGGFRRSRRRAFACRVLNLICRLNARRRVQLSHRKLEAFHSNLEPSNATDSRLGEGFRDKPVKNSTIRTGEVRHSDNRMLRLNKFCIVRRR